MAVTDTIGSRETVQTEKKDASSNGTQNIEQLDPYGFPFEAVDEFTDAPLEFEELTASLWEDLTDTYVLSTRYNRHSPYYVFLCAHLEKDIRQLGSLCVTKAVLEQKDMKFPKLEGLTVKELYRMVSLHFRKCHTAFQELKSRGQGIDMNLMDWVCRWGMLAEKLKATEEKIRKIQSGKVSADSILERSGVFSDQPGEPRTERRTPQEISRITSLPVMASYVRELVKRKRQAELIANNRAYYQQNLLQHRLLISRLSTGIMNSVLLHMQPAPIKANSGILNPALVWRAAKLDDERVFTRTENANAGDFSVDILLDASHSQITRAAKISSQAYIIAEALSRCHVPCRVMSFCSMSGFTILRLFNDYFSGDNSGIFDYYTEGCNRDGLAIRAAGNLMSQSSYEHKMLIVLSDVKPLDIAKIRKDERDVGVSYDALRALTDTAHEVRRLRVDGPRQPEDVPLGQGEP